MKSVYAIAIFVCLMSALNQFEYAKAESTSHNDVANVLDNEENGGQVSLERSIFSKKDKLIISLSILTFTYLRKETDN